MPDGATPYFYRTSGGAELDLLIEMPDGERWAFEIKRGTRAAVGRGFHSALADVQPARATIVTAGAERHRLRPGVEAVGLLPLLTELERSA